MAPLMSDSISTHTPAPIIHAVSASNNISDRTGVLLRQIEDDWVRLVAGDRSDMWLRDLIRRWGNLGAYFI